MADNFTNYAGKALLEHITGRTAMVAPSHTYLALFTVAPSDSTAGIEASGGNYARPQLAWGAANESTGEIAISSLVRFPATGTATANWGTLVALGIFDAPTGGNLLCYGPLRPTFTVNSGESFQVAAGGITLSLG